MSSRLAKHLKIVHFASIVLLLFTGPIFSQSHRLTFDRLSIEQGLSQSNIACILQDSRGFMWFGTTDGLNKYDGYDFTVYKHNPSDPFSLSRNEILSLAEDSSDRLWIGTYGGGLGLFDRKAEQFVAFKHEADNPASLSDDYILSLCVDPVRKNVLWIGTEGGGLNRLEVWPHETDPDSVTFSHWKNDPDNPNSLLVNAISSIYVDKSGVLWLGPNGGGLARFDPQTEKFTHWLHDQHNSKSLSNDWINAIYEFPPEPDASSRHKRILWLGTHGGGLNQFDIEKEVFNPWINESNNPNSLYITDMYLGNSGALWIGTDGGGLNRFDLNSRTFTQWINEPNNPRSLSDNEVSAIYMDKSGVLWVGTIGGGVCKVSRNRLQKGGFRHWFSVPGDQNSLSMNDVTAIFEDKAGVIWVGTYGGGVNQFDRRTGTFQHWMSTPEDIDGLGIDLFYPQVNNVISFLEDSRGILWMGTYGGKFVQFDRERNKYVHWPYAYGVNTAFGGGLNQKYVLALHEEQSDSGSVYWIGTHGGGLNQMVWDGQDRVGFNHWVYEQKNAWGLNNNDVRCIYKDRSEMLWLGTAGGGVNILDPAKGTFTYLKNTPGDSTSLSSNYVQVIYEDNAGVVWVGTEGGLNRFDSETHRFQQYKQKDGLPDDNICGILEDKRGNLWLSTKNGLSRFNPETGSFRNYDVYDGLQSNEFNRGAYLRSQDGELFFGGINGLSSFYPDSIAHNLDIPQVAITDFKISDKPVKISPQGGTVLTKHISETDEIVLSYTDNVFSFEFAALDYNSSTKNQYAYRMEGFDEDWIYSGTRRFTTYTNLDPGRYIFRVKASNNDGVWNEEGKSIAIVITPPFWETWWFRILLFTAIIGIITLFLNYRISRRLEMERIRTRIASDLHDDIGATLTRIAIHSEIIQTTKEAKKILPSAKKIGDMSREIVTTMSDIVWSIDARNDSVGDLVDRMRNFAMNTLSPKHIKTTFNVSGLDSSRKLPVDVRQNVYLIFKEAINNIAKHASATKVDIQLRNSDGEFYLAISDDGAGFDESTERAGQGLKNMRMRAERIVATLEILHNKGTRVVLRTKSI